MVFHRQPKTRQRSAPAWATINDLPHELLLTVFDHFETKSIANLRLASRHLEPVCNTTLAARLHRLYIHSTTPSLRQALLVCAHPIYRQHIEEIVVLGKIPWSESRLATRKSEGWQEFCAWPSQFPRDTKAGVEIMPTKAAVSTFQEGYEQLLVALTGLPKLQKLRFSGSALEPGWNKSSQAIIDAHATKTKKSRPGSLGARFTDMDAVLAILASTTFTSLQLDDELPLSQDLARSAQLHSILENLTNLDLTLLSMKSNGAFYPQLIRRALPMLRRLRLVISSKHGRRPGSTFGRDLAPLLPEPSSSSDLDSEPPATGLETLILEHEDPPPHPKCVDKRRLSRPDRQYFDLVAFLRQFKQSLKHVRIQNMMFMDAEGSRSGSIAESLNTVREAMLQQDVEAFPRLQHFEWRINRYNHHEKCKSKLTYIELKCQKLKCSEYDWNCPRSDIERLADRFGVDLEPGQDGLEYGSWDFGEGIMRELRNARGAVDVLK